MLKQADLYISEVSVTACCWQLTAAVAVDGSCACAATLQGLHPRLIVEGFDIAKKREFRHPTCKAQSAGPCSSPFSHPCGSFPPSLPHTEALDVLENMKISREMDRDTLINVSRTSLRTKLSTRMADLLTEVRRSGCAEPAAAGPHSPRAMPLFSPPPNRPLSMLC